MDFWWPWITTWAEFCLDKQLTSPIVKIYKKYILCQVNPVTKFYLFLRMLSHLMIYHDIVRSGDCYKICLGGSLSRNKGCKSFFLCGDNNQWLLCCHDGKACKKKCININVRRYIFWSGILKAINKLWAEVKSGSTRLEKTLGLIVYAINDIMTSVDCLAPQILGLDRSKTVFLKCS